jgi:hypothetical protein
VQLILRLRALLTVRFCHKSHTTLQMSV